MNMKERVVYLQGLAEGINFKESSKEGKIITEMLDILADMADMIDDIVAEQLDMQELVDEIDDDLAELEDSFYEEDDEECCCSDGAADEDYDEEDLVEMTCPECGEVVLFDKDILESDEAIEVICPVCDAVVFDNENMEYTEPVDDKEEDCDCGCKKEE